jgi:hypothetical protein
MSPRSAFCTALLASVLLLGSAASAAVWSEREQIGSFDNYEDYQPNVAVDPQDRAWVVWMGVDNVGPPDYEIYWCRWEKGVGWSPRQRLHADNTQNDSWPRLSIAPDGTPWVAWLRPRPNGYGWDLLSSHWRGSSWTVPDTVVKAPGISEANYQGIAAIDSTHCWVAYDGVYVVRAREYQGDHWGPEEQVAAGMADDPRQVDAAAGPNGQPWVIWTESDVRTSRRLPDGTWEPSILLGPGQEAATFMPAIAVDSSGEAWAVWHNYSDCIPEGWEDIFFSRTIQGVWQSMGVVNDPEPMICAKDVAADIDASHGGPPRVVWGRKNPATATTNYREPYSSGWDSEGWEPQCRMQEPDSTTLREDNYATVAVRPDGGAWAAWMRRNSIGWSDVYVSELLVDVADFHASRAAVGAQISWRLVGSAKREDFLFTVLRASAMGDTTKIGESFTGSGDDYLVVDESANPQTGYSYWIQVSEVVSGAPRFRTNSRRVEPLIVSVETMVWDRRPVIMAVPNPSRGRVEFRVTALRGNCSLEIFDVQGRRVWVSQVDPSQGGEVEIRWPLSSSAQEVSGVFWARLRSDKGGVLATTKFVHIP